MHYPKILFKSWAYLHLFFVIGVCCFSAYDKYHKFYKLKRIATVDWLSVNLLFQKFELAYGRISGTGSGYGFFAPNVKANGLILGDCDGTIISPEFRSYESSVRFNSLSSRVTDYLVDMGDSISIEKQQMEAQYYDLLFKNIAVKMYGQHHCRSDTFYVSYNILTFPTLAQFRQRKGVGEHKLRPVKEVKLTKLDYK